MISELSLQDLKAGNRRALAKAITLVESTNPKHQAAAEKLLQSIMPDTGKARRIGISGSPGVGKSSLIEALGLVLVREEKLKVAVIAVDPSSPIAGGSILGDKTRMEQLAREENAFIRPSPAGDALGGVAKRTREVMLLCEAAGYQVCIVETVGVGQSEHMVANMVDFFLLLLLPSAGDELQGIKRGIVELADGVVITKHDGETKKPAELTQTHYQNALKLLHHPFSWSPTVLTSSIKDSTSMVKIWQMLNDFWQTVGVSGLEDKRAKQNKHWMRQHLNTMIDHYIRNDDRIGERIKVLEMEVMQGSLSSFQAAKEIFSAVMSPVDTR